MGVHFLNSVIHWPLSSWGLLQVEVELKSLLDTKPTAIVGSYNLRLS